jgi:hypothetical protein
MAFKHLAVRNQTPRNDKAVRVATTSLQQMAPLFQKQYENALEVNGYDCLYFMIKRTGRVCTCRSAPAQTQTGTVQLDDDGKASPEDINRILTGSDFKINSYGPTNKSGFDDLQIGLSTSEEQAPGKSRSSSKRGKTMDDFEASSVDISIPNSRNQGYETDDPAIESDNDNPIGHGTDLACAVCFGTGFVGGFDLFRGVKITCDTTHEPSTITGLRLKNTVHPYVFESFKVGATADFKVLLPRGAVSIESVRVFENTSTLWGGYKIEVFDDVWTTPVELTGMGPQLLQFCTGRECTVRLTVTDKAAASLDSPFRFSHIDIQVLMSDVPTRIDYPHFNHTSDPAVLDGTQEVSLNLPPTVPYCYPNDMVFDKQTHKLWRIESSEDFTDRILNPHGYTCQARLVQPFELLSLVSARFHSPRRSAKLMPLNGNWKHNRRSV